MNDHLLSTISSHLQVLTLNRPAALNALDHNMIRGLDQAARTKDPRPLLMTGRGDRAFCAGGDIKAAYAGGMAARNGAGTLQPVLDYFHDEYRMNAVLAATKRTTIALLNGVTMGGGVGVAAPCKYRVGCENTIWAMPETGIGFFPDVGTMYYLHQCPEPVGRFLALTGHIVRHASTMLAWGLITHYVPRDRHDDLIKSISNSKIKSIANILDEFHVPPPDTPPEIDLAILDVFNDPDPISIRDHLPPHGASVLESRCPHSVVTAALYYDWSKGRNLAQVLAKDHELAIRFLQHPDFYEGIRAQVMDKDRNPRWRDASLEAVDQSAIAGYF